MEVHTTQYTSSGRSSSTIAANHHHPPVHFSHRQLPSDGTVTLTRREEGTPVAAV